MTDAAMVSRKNDGRPDGPVPLVDEQLADELLGKIQPSSHSRARARRPER
jgi:hypothetical protein